MTLRLENRLHSREQLGNLRKLQLPKPLVDFCSNDYLGLSRSTYLSASLRKEWDLANQGLGSTGSRLLTGNSLYAQDLEQAIAVFHGYETGLLFNCGYMANLGLISAIAGASDTLIFDASVHASMRDGIVLSRAQAFPFKHNDLKHLEQRLKRSSLLGDRFICVESLYSTDGSLAPLPELCRLASEYEAHLIVDEAHAIGVLGPQGRGLVAEHDLSKQVFAQINTFGKALGTHGAIVLGSHSLKELLINFATAFIYTTAHPMYVLMAIKCSYDLFPKLESERAHLQKLVRKFGEGAHIQALPFKGNEAVKHASKKLSELGFDVRPLMSPTVQRGHEVLRVCLHAFNTETELEELLKHV